MSECGSKDARADVPTVIFRGAELEDPRETDGGDLAANLERCKQLIKVMTRCGMEMSSISVAARISLDGIHKRRQTESLVLLICMLQLGGRTSVGNVR